jgi:gamma-glutamyltranspeptidase/glutathione hydrolase
VAQRADQSRLALGSGGSSRIRSAITQVLVNLLDFELSPEEAVSAPRIHLEDEMLSIEGGFNSKALRALQTAAPETHEWSGKNLFFGGVHMVSVSPDGDLKGAGDPRRGGEVTFAAL